MQADFDLEQVNYRPSKSGSGPRPTCRISKYDLGYPSLNVVVWITSIGFYGRQFQKFVGLLLRKCCLCGWLYIQFLSKVPPPRFERSKLEGSNKMQLIQAQRV